MPSKSLTSFSFPTCWVPGQDLFRYMVVFRLTCPHHHSRFFLIMLSNLSNPVFHVTSSFLILSFFSFNLQWVEVYLCMFLVVEVLHLNITDTNNTFNGIVIMFSVNDTSFIWLNLMWVPYQNWADKKARVKPVVYQSLSVFNQLVRYLFWHYYTYTFVHKRSYIFFTVNANIRT